MRDIKIRAWDGKRFIYRGIHDRNWYTESKKGKLVKGTHPRDRNMNTYEYTDFKDKFGVGVCEGDICKLDNNFIALVEFKHGAFGFSYSDDLGHSFEVGAWGDGCVIVGIVHEIPVILWEILKGA